MRILLVESSCYKPLNPYFAGALKDLSPGRGWEYMFIDEADFFPNRLPLLDRLCAKLVKDHSWRRRDLYNRSLRDAAASFRPDVLLLVNGKLIAPATLRAIKRGTAATLINYATDDPFNPVVSTRYFRQSVSEFDIFATPKKAIIQDLNAAGCVKAIRTLFAYSPEIHYSEEAATDTEKARFDCDVAFIGSCDRDRPIFFQTLLKRTPTLRLAIYGAGGWERYRSLRPYLRGEVRGRDFRLAVSGAKITLNFIRHANRDDHSERAFQLAACGAFILSERLQGQAELLTEDRDAVYFTSPQELTEKVEYYLGRAAARTRIAMSGHERITSGRHTCKDRLLELLSMASDKIASDGTLANL